MSAPFKLTDEQRALVAVEYETQLALNMAKTGKPTQANARAVLMAAARMAVDTGVQLKTFLAAASEEWSLAKKRKPVIGKEDP